MYFSLPNIISLSRVVISPFFLYFLLNQEAWSIQLATILFAIGAFTDYLDGWLARKFKLSSNLGKFLDPLADKVLTFAAFLAFTLLDILPIWMLILISARDSITTFMRLYTYGQAQTVETSKSAKWKTFLQMFAIVFVLLLLLGRANSTSQEMIDTYTNTIYSEFVFYMMFGLTTFSLITLIEYIFNNIKLFIKPSKNENL